MRCLRRVASTPEWSFPWQRQTTIYDVAIIGGGPAGYTAAIRGAELGLKVALIDNAPRLGGTCLHVGCIPTKALLFNAEIWDHLKHAADFGLASIGTPTLDWSAVLKRKDAIITKHVKGLEFLMKKNKITVIAGTGKLTGPAQAGVHTVDVTQRAQRRREPGEGEERDSRLRLIGQDASRPCSPTAPSSPTSRFSPSTACPNR